MHVHQMLILSGFHAVEVNESTYFMYLTIKLTGSDPFEYTAIYSQPEQASNIMDYIQILQISRSCGNARRLYFKDISAQRDYFKDMDADT